jgi:hypothetical protein
MFENIENDRKIKWSPILVTIKTRSKSINFVALVPALIFFGETQKQASKHCIPLSRHRMGSPA